MWYDPSFSHHFTGTAASTIEYGSSRNDSQLWTDLEGDEQISNSDHVDVIDPNPYYLAFLRVTWSFVFFFFVYVPFALLFYLINVVFALSFFIIAMVCLHTRICNIWMIYEYVVLIQQLSSARSGRIAPRSRNAVDMGYLIPDSVFYNVHWNI